MAGVPLSRAASVFLQALFFISYNQYRGAGLSLSHTSVCRCDNINAQCHIQGRLTLDREVYMRGSHLRATCAISSSTSPCGPSPTSMSVQLSGRDLTHDTSDTTSATFSSEALTEADNNATVACYMAGYYKSDSPSELDHIDRTRISIGVLPERPYNISCVVTNMESMSCTWQPAKQNTGIPTTQTLYYKKHSFYLSPEADIDTPCRYQRENMCFWKYRFASDIDAQIYSNGYIYGIQVTAQNALGSVTSQQQIVKSKYYVKLSEVRDLVCEKTAKSSLELSWKQPLNEYYQQMIICEVKIWSPWQQDYIRNLNRSSRNVTFVLTIAGLTPHTQYTATIRCITPLVYMTERRDEMWSDCARLKVATRPDVAYAAPSVTSGGYRMITDDQVQVFWQPVPLRLLNGQITATRVRYFPRQNQSESASCEGSGTTLTVDAHRTSSILPLTRESSFDVCVDVVNQVGANDTLVLQPIRIPDTASKLPVPRFYAVGSSNKITIFLQEQSNMTYTLFWCSGILAVCRNQDHQSYNWRAVTSSVCWLNASRDTTLVGLSAEYSNEWGHNTSSGITFAPYIFHTENRIQAPSMLRVVDQPAASERVALEWTKPSWRDTAYIRHFTVSYCLQSACPHGESVNVSVAGLLDRASQRYTVTGLQGERLYSFTVRSVGDNQTSNSTTPVTATPPPRGLRKLHVVIIGVTATLLALCLLAGIYTIGRYLRRKVKDYFSPFDVVIPEVTETYFHDATTASIRYCDVDQTAQKAVYWGRESSDEEGDETDPRNNHGARQQGDTEVDQRVSHKSDLQESEVQASNHSAREESGHGGVMPRSSSVSDYTRVTRQASVVSDGVSSPEDTDGRHVPPASRCGHPQVQRMDSSISGSYVTTDDSGQLLHHSNSCHDDRDVGGGAARWESAEEDPPEEQSCLPRYQRLQPTDGEHKQLLPSTEGNHSQPVTVERMSSHHTDGAHAHGNMSGSRATYVEPLMLADDT